MRNPNIDDISMMDDEIDFKELFDVLWQGKWNILVITFIFSISAVFYSLSLPNIYESKALLNPVDQNEANQAFKSYSGLASLAGVNLSQSGSGNVSKAKVKVKTLSFFENHILPNIHLPDLMAVDSWTPATGLVYNNDVFDYQTNSWIKKVPSPQKSFKAFKDILYVSQNTDTGFISISIKHQSPEVAKLWVELIVDELNKFFRSKDNLEALAAMDYLNNQMLKTSFAEIKQVIAALLQEKMQQLTLIEANEFYVFSYLDPPVVMEKKSEPTRSVICIIGALFGFILGMVIVLLRHYSK